MSKIGDLIRSERLRADMGLRELARKAGLAHATLGKIERGESDQPRLKTLEAIARALGRDVELFLPTDRQDALLQHRARDRTIQAAVARAGLGLDMRRIERGQHTDKELRQVLKATFNDHSPLPWNAWQPEHRLQSYQSTAIFQRDDAASFRFGYVIEDPDYEPRQLVGEEHAARVSQMAEEVETFRAGIRDNPELSDVEREELLAWCAGTLGLIAKCGRAHR